MDGAGADQRTARLIAVVVTFNRLAHIKLTVPRLLSEPIDRVVVVDNGSTDGSREWLRAQVDDRLRVVESPVNGGGAGGIEMGMRTAMAEDAPDWLIIMDDDARPEPGAIAQFRQMNLEGADAVSGGAYMPDGTVCEMNRPSINPFWHRGMLWKTLLKGRMGFHVSDAAYEEAGLKDIDAGSFVGLFVSRKVVEAVGYPDGRLFIYGDDVMYTLGLSKAGFRLVFAPSVRFEHDCSAVAGWGSGPKVYRPYWKIYYNYRNGLLMYRMAAGPLFFWPVLVLSVLRWVRSAGAYGEDRAIYLKLLRLGILDALRNRRDRTHAEIMAIAEAPTPPPSG